MKFTFQNQMPSPNRIAAGLERVERFFATDPHEQPDIFVAAVIRFVG